MQRQLEGRRRLAAPFFPALERFAATDDFRVDVEADFAAERFAPTRDAAVFLAPVARFAAILPAPLPAPDLVARAVERLALAPLLRDAADFFAAGRLALVFAPALDDFAALLPGDFAVLLRLAAAFFAEADRAAAGRAADAAPLALPPRFADAVVSFLPRPEPLLLPPPLSLLTVAQARRSASSSGTPRLS